MKQSLFVVLSRRVCGQALMLGGLAAVVAGLGMTRADTDPKWYAVEVSAEVQSNPAQIRLVWEADPNAAGYTIYRKLPKESNWSQVTALDGSAVRFVDPGVSAGVAYEYEVAKRTSVGYQGFGYVMAGMTVAPVEDRGSVILVVDSTYATDLAGELARLQQDLVGDGWTVLRHDVSRSDSVLRVKQLIQADYYANPSGVRSVFLFGHVAVPYSGSLNPDGHPDHQGAWPADVFYGDMDGTWTDNSVNISSSVKPQNYNVPGDGKFDQNEIPSDVELEVGRVDLSNMTCFANKTPSRSELDLLRQYLNKDHNFRHKLIDLPRRGLVCDNFGERNGEAFAASGWRNFASFFGAPNVQSVPGWQYFSTLSQSAYLWSYGCGGGGFYTCDGIGSSDDFARTDIQSVFTMFLGSYFGDWDNESNFLRAPLGSSSYCLASMWAGRPHWFVHPMGLGQTIGYCTRMSQNNARGGLYQAQNLGSRGIHIALMGDPTLRMHAVAPVPGLTATLAAGGVTLNWQTSPEAVGYHVYRGRSAAGPFARVSGADPLTATSFTDSGLADGSYTYMVRAVKLETSGSGTYYNLSEGIFQTVQIGAGGRGTQGGLTSPQAPVNLTATAANAVEVDLSWQGTDASASGYKIERAGGTDGFQAIGSVSSGVAAYRDLRLPAGGYRYRVRAFNAAGDSPASNEASAQLVPAVPGTPAIPAAGTGASFLLSDSSTRGDWKNSYGTDGLWVNGDAPQIPSYVEANVNGGTPYAWSDTTDDARALQRASGAGRIASCWYASDRFQLDFRFKDGAAHPLGLYFMDWDNKGRSELVEVVDTVTGATLDQRTVSGFGSGTYLVWQLSGNVSIRVTRQAGNNVVVNGMFFGRVAAHLDNSGSGTLSLIPNSTTGAVQVRINGQAGQVFAVDCSSDMRSWNPIGTVTLDSSIGYLDDPEASGSVQRFYRAVLQR